MRRVYLDHAATTTVRPEVVDAMTPWLLGGYNASSLHAEGRAARAAIDDARETVARLLGVMPGEVVFTGGGTEANNLAIFGVAEAREGDGRHIVATAIEHPAVMAALDALEARGWEVTRLRVGSDGVVDPGDVAAALRPDTVLASVMLANNEIGTIQPVAELAAIARSRRVVMHTDAVQTPGWLPLGFNALGVDLMTLAAHKFRGPRSAGALIVRNGTPLASRQLGGAQERGRRAGTEDVAGITGFARALELAEMDRLALAGAVGARRDRFAAALAGRIPGLRINVPDALRLPNHLSVTVDGIPSDALIAALDLEGIAASAGSACAAGSLEPSHVLAAIGLPPDGAGVVRFSLGHTTTDGDLDHAVEVAARVVRRALTAVPLR